MSDKPDDVRPSKPSWVTFLKQAVAISLATWFLTALVFLGWVVFSDESPRRAAALAALVVALFFFLGGGTLMGRVTIAYGASRWGVGPTRYTKVYEDEGPGEHLTFLGAALIVGPQLLVTALWLLD